MESNKKFNLYEVFIASLLFVLSVLFHEYISKTWIWEVSPLIFTPLFLVMLFLFVTCGVISKKCNTFFRIILSIIVVHFLLMGGMIGSDKLFQNISIEKIKAKQEEFRTNPLYQADLIKISLERDDLTSKEQDIYKEVLLRVTNETPKSRVILKLMKEQERLREMDKNMGDYIDKKSPLISVLI